MEGNRNLDSFFSKLCVCTTGSYMCTDEAPNRRERRRCGNNNKQAARGTHDYLALDLPLFVNAAALFLIFERSKGGLLMMALLFTIGPVVEIGAGAGVWGALLCKRGLVHCVCYDSAPPAHALTHVLPGGPTMACTCIMLALKNPFRFLKKFS